MPGGGGNGSGSGSVDWPCGLAPWVSPTVSPRVSLGAATLGLSVKPSFWISLALWLEACGSCASGCSTCLSGSSSVGTMRSGSRVSSPMMRS